MAQLSLPFCCTHREVALWIIWESLCDALYCLFFLLLFVLFYVKSKSNVSSLQMFQRRYELEENCSRCRPRGVSDKVGDEESLLGHFHILVQKPGKKATIPGFHWTAVQAGLSACAFQCSSQAEIGRVEGSSEYCNTNCPGGYCNTRWKWVCAQILMHRASDMRILYFVSPSQKLAW